MLGERGVEAREETRDAGGPFGKEAGGLWRTICNVKQVSARCDHL